MMRKSFWKSAGFVALGAVMSTALMQALNVASASNSDTYRQLNLFGDVFDRVRSLEKVLTSRSSLAAVCEVLGV